MLVARSQIPMVRGDRSMLMPTICQLPPNGTRWRACFRIVNVLIGTKKSEHAVWSAKRDVSCHRWTSGGRDSASQYLKVDLARCLHCYIVIHMQGRTVCWTVHSTCCIEAAYYSITPKLSHSLSLFLSDRCCMINDGSPTMLRLTCFTRHVPVAIYANFHQLKFRSVLTKSQMVYSRDPCPSSSSEHASGSPNPNIVRSTVEQNRSICTPGYR